MANLFQPTAILDRGDRCGDLVEETTLGTDISLVVACRSKFYSGRGTGVKMGGAVGEDPFSYPTPLFSLLLYGPGFPGFSDAIAVDGAPSRGFDRDRGDRHCVTVEALAHFGLDLARYWLADLPPYGQNRPDTDTGSVSA